MGRAKTGRWRGEEDRINSNQRAFETRSYLDLSWRLQLRWLVPRDQLGEGL